MDLLWQEFTAGFRDWPQFARVVLRLSVAILLGGVVGYERERAGRWAGLRTHMLVALGSALFVLIPAQGGVDMGETTRVIQGIATGIGFIGAGSILKLPDERRIEGLTTASAVWVTASVGVAAGLGFVGPAVLGVAFGWMVLRMIGLFERRGDGSVGADRAP